MRYSYTTWLIRTGHDSFTCDMTHSYVTWLIHMCHDLFICDMTHLYATWLIHVCQESRHVTRLIHVCDMTHSYVWHDSFVCVTWPIHHMCVKSHVMWHDSSIRYRLILILCDMTHPHVTWLIRMWHDLSTCDMTHTHVPWLIHMSHDSSVSCHLTLVWACPHI